MTSTTGRPARDCPSHHDCWGLHRGRLHNRVKGQRYVVRNLFPANGAFPLVRRAGKRTFCRSFEAPDVIGKVICELHARLAELNRFEDRARAAEHFLLPYANRSRAYDPMTIAADHIFRARGVVRIENLTRGYGLGRRQFERRFSASIGLTPKLFARVARFQTALDTKVAFPNRRWLDIAHGLGYHDQMHLIHDFHDLAGAPPEATMASLGDARPPAFVNQSQKDRKSHFY